MAEQEVVVNGVLPREQSSPSSSADNTPATLYDLKKLESSIVSQLKAMMMELITPKPNPIIDNNRGVNASPSQVDSLPCVEIVEQSTNSHREKDLEDVDTSSKGKDASPSSDYDSNAQMSMPCIMTHGPPPLLESNSFGDWKLLMHSHVRSTSIELWRIIKEGYSPKDPMNLTRREVVDHQLNSIAIDMIHLSITPKERAHIQSLKTAKEAWDELDKLFLGNGDIQCSHLSEAMANDFVMIEGESPEEMYQRLIAFAIQMQDLGVTFVDDRWIEKKFYNALLPWSGNKKPNSRSRNSCFNCRDKSHFVADCLYKPRDLYGGYLIRKSKFRPLPKRLPNNHVTKISFTDKPRTNMLQDEDHMVENERLEKKKELELISLTQAYEEEVCMRMTLETSALILEDYNNSLISQLKDRDYALGWLDKLKTKKDYLEEDHEWSIEDVATFAKKKEDEGPNSCCDKLLDEVCFLRKHNAKFLDVISTQEEALDEYYRLSKEKVQCCDHEEEIATLKKHKAKLVEVNERQNESLLEWIRLSKEKVTCCNHEDEIAYLKRSKDKLMVVKLMQDEAIEEYKRSSKDYICCNHEDDIATLERHKHSLLRRNSLLEEALVDREDEANDLRSEIESLQIQVQFLEGVIEAHEDLCNEGEVAIMPKKIEREGRINEAKNMKVEPIEKWAPISNS
ncbi:hypothetical protein QYE76_065599 [Lolium multiflorum]|uniref:CCHC-type domain-containing protein n=1 Tax=Lolium multiflorum TaxID=4521 RepID=A0AAD8WB64_LOLMU|nr:hypothetical protein QYE76_065599 [Lolium multiflorum]